MPIKHIIFISILIILSFTTSIMAEPIKKQPAKENNFEIIEGSLINAPIDTKKMNSSILKAAANIGWIVEDTKPGEIFLKYDNKNWWVKIRVCYTKNEYWFEYLDSYNLDANPAKNKIHRNYDNRWIPHLQKNIYNFYTNPNQKVTPTIFPTSRVGDFTNIEGKTIRKPIDITKFQKAAKKSAEYLGWTILEDTKGALTIRYSNGTWWVKTKIVYNENGYSYKYIDSYKLKADKSKNIIHKNYTGRWIPNLEKNIAANYY